jgi:glutathione S-transferase
LLKAGKLVVTQTANILFYLGPHLKLAPSDEAGRLWAHQLQLTISDLVVEIHDTHHPVSGWLYFEEQRPAARRRSQDFWRYRVPKFLGYFERVLQKNGGQYLIGRRLSYIDLSLFQVVEGLRYAFPKHMKRFEKKVPGLIALHDRVANRPRIKAYLASKRRNNRIETPIKSAFFRGRQRIGRRIAPVRSAGMARRPGAPISGPERRANGRASPRDCGAI